MDDEEEEEKSSPVIKSTIERENHIISLEDTFLSLPTFIVFAS